MSSSTINVVCLSLWYPLTMSRYFENAFNSLDDVNLITVGPYTGNWIPWRGGIELDRKYAKSPTIPIGNQPIQALSWELVERKLNVKPDVIVCIDAGIRWAMKPNAGCPVVHVATDPHVLDYSIQRTQSDFFFNMQKRYMKDGDIYLPYAFDHTKIYRENYTDKSYDGALIGMPYPNRMRLVEQLRQRGYSIAFENGPIFDEYRHINNQSLVGINWSSLEDLTCRVFEIMGMGLVPLINRVPDLSEHFVEDEHYFGFSDLQEAINKFEYIVTATGDDALKIQQMAHKAETLVHKSHKYLHRAHQILDTVFPHRKRLRELQYIRQNWHPNFF